MGGRSSADVPSRVGLRHAGRWQYRVVASGQFEITSGRLVLRPCRCSDGVERGRHRGARRDAGADGRGDEALDLLSRIPESDRTCEVAAAARLGDALGDDHDAALTAL